MEIGDLYIEDGVALGQSRDLNVKNDEASWHELGEYGEQKLGDFDIILYFQGIT